VLDVTFVSQGLRWWRGIVPLSMPHLTMHGGWAKLALGSRRWQLCDTMKAQRCEIKRRGCVQRGFGPWSPDHLSVSSKVQPPGPPVRTQVVTQTSDSIKLHWGTYSGVDAVVSSEVQAAAITPAARVRWGTTAWRTVYRGKTEGCVVQSLLHDCAYQLRVRHESEGGAGPWSKGIMVRTARMRMCGACLIGSMCNVCPGCDQRGPLKASVHWLCMGEVVQLYHSKL
jgi:hypothetical protein